MSSDARYILDYRRKKYSLEGEEGILEYILNKIPKSDRDNFVVEFGAYDGIAFSNSIYFIKEFGFEAIEIEADNERFCQLEINMEPYNVECIQSFVEQTGKNTLDNILNNSKKTVPSNFDLLVIDVDNNDYQLWESFVEYNPKIVMIEINNTLLPSEDKISKYNAEFVFGKHGSSIKSMTDLAEVKGYKLICNVSCNAVYVKEEYFNLFFDRNYAVEDFYTFEGFSVRRWFFEVPIRYKLRKFFEAIRRDKVLFEMNTVAALFSVVRNLFVQR